MTITVEPVAGDGVHAPLALLEETLRAGEPLPDALVEEVRRAIRDGEMEVLAARDAAGETIGVLVLHFRPSVSAGGLFASIEELYVIPELRRRGVGGNLLGAAHERCKSRGVSYVEVQVVEQEAGNFYAAFGYESEEEVRLLSCSLPLREGSSEGSPTWVHRNSSTS